MAFAIFPFMVLAAIGLLLSIAAHVIALLGLPIPGGKLVWSLHIGIFVVWLPAVLVASRANRGKPRSDLWKTVLSGCPPWMRYAGYGLFAYAIANFIWFMVVSSSNPAPAGDAPSLEIRGFSGHWMVFYGVAFAILFSAYRNPRLLQQLRCTNGHEISASDTFCPKCGSKISVPSLGV
jgi:hypothetical protein